MRTSHCGPPRFAPLWNLALWDQGAPPVAACCARRVGDVACIHRGTGGVRSAHAARPARRSPRPAAGCAATGGAVDRASCKVTSSGEPPVYHLPTPQRPVIV